MSVKIREAVQDDTVDIVLVLKEFHKESRFSKFDLNLAKLTGMVSSLTNSSKGIVLVAEDSEKGVVGVFLGVIGEHYFGNSLASEDKAIYLLPGYRGRGAGVGLIQTYVKIAQERGVEDITISHFSNIKADKTDKLYERLGFKRQGGLYSLGG